VALRFAYLMLARALSGWRCSPRPRTDATNDAVIMLLRHEVAVLRRYTRAEAELGRPRAAQRAQQAATTLLHRLRLVSPRTLLRWHTQLVAAS
jgi:hypothetical protein